MEMQYFKWYSRELNRDMEMKVYGHAGRPVLFIPCQDGRYFDFENFKMTDTWAPWIENGEVMVFSIDTMDVETWSGKGDPRWRIERHEQWMRYIVHEVAPFIQNMANERNGWQGTPGIITFGCSLGATHAANLFFRFPYVFDGMLALSGIFSATFGWENYWDEDVYNNSPVDYLANMSNDHPYIEKYRSNRGIICVGQGAWEMPETTRRLAELSAEKNMGVWVDFWGHDVAHDWDWWYKQVPYFMPHLLGR